MERREFLRLFAALPAALAACVHRKPQPAQPYLHNPSEDSPFVNMYDELDPALLHHGARFGEPQVEPPEHLYTWVPRKEYRDWELRGYKVAGITTTPIVDDVLMRKGLG